MNDAPFLLERHVFRRVEIVAAPTLPSQARQVPINVSLSYGEHISDAGRFTLVVEVNIGSRAEESALTPYSGTVTAEGFFETSVGVEAAPPRHIVVASASGILLGAIREMVANITSRGPYPTVVIKTLTFGEMAKLLLEKHASETASRSKEHSQAAASA